MTSKDSGSISISGLNQIQIFEPRWHDETVLVADHRLKTYNEIVIEHEDFPEPFFLTGEEARKYPLMYMKTKAGGQIAVREIPLSELRKEVIDI